MDAVDELIQELRTRVLRPGFLDNHAARGCLGDNGVNLWEMPDADQKAGGYYNALRQIAHVPESQSFYAQLVGSRPDCMNKYLSVRDISKGYDFDLHYTPHATIDLNDFARLTVYRAGNAVCLQNMVYAPVRVATQPAPTFPWRFHAYDEVACVVEKAKAQGLRLYANIGFANNPKLLSNEYELALKYAQVLSVDAAACVPVLLATDRFDIGSEVSLPANAYAPSVADMGQLGVQEEATGRFCMFHGSVTTPEEGVPIPVPEPHPDLVASVLSSIQHAVRTFGRGTCADMTFLVGGETHPYERPKSVETTTGIELPCSGPITTGNCHCCRPITNYSDAAKHFFVEYLWLVVLSEIDIGDPDAKLAALESRWNGPVPIELKAAPVPSEKRPDVDPDLVHECGFSVQAVRDFEASGREIVRALFLAQYRAAKSEAPCGTYAILGGLERGWLYSDRPNTIRFYGNPKGLQPDPTYTEALLFEDCARARLSGVPMVVAPSSPAGQAAPGGLGGNLAPKPDPECGPAPSTAFGTFLGGPFEATKDRYTTSPAFVPRCMSQDHVRIYFRDVLSAGTSFVSPYKGILFGLNTEPAPGRERPGSWGNVWPVLSLFRDWVNPYLGFTSPHQAVVIHEDLDADDLSTESPHRSEYQHAIAQRLVKYFQDEQITYALTESEDVRGRLFARDAMRHSITISAFPRQVQQLRRNLNDPDLEARAFAFLDDHKSIVDGADGAVLVLIDDIDLAIHLFVKGFVPQGGGLQVFEGPFAAFGWRNSSNCIVALILEGKEFGAGQTPEVWADFIFDRILRIALRWILENVNVVARVVELTEQSPVDNQLQSNYVTDGVNLFIAVTNRDPDPAALASFELGIDLGLASKMPIRSVATRYDVFDVENTSGTATPIAGAVTLRGEETRFFYARASGPDGPLFRGQLSDLLDKVDDFEARITTELDGYETEHAVRLIQAIRAVEGSGTLDPKGRILAGLVRLSEMIFLRVERGVATADEVEVTIHARRIWNDERAEPGVGPLGLADVQVLHVLNGHEPQRWDSEDFSAGSRTLTVTRPRKLIWDFLAGALGEFKVNAEAELDSVSPPPFEVHVHDRVTGAEAFVVDLGAGICGPEPVPNCPPVSECPPPLNSAPACDPPQPLCPPSPPS